MKHPLVFRCLVGLSRATCWLLLVASTLWIFELIKLFFLGEPSSNVELLDLWDTLAIPMFGAGIYLLLNRVRLALASYAVFSVGALIMDPSMEAVAVCAVLGLILFSPLALLSNENQHSSAPEEKSE